MSEILGITYPLSVGELMIFWIIGGLLSLLVEARNELNRLREKNLLRALFHDIEISPVAMLVGYTFRVFIGGWFSFICSCLNIQKTI